jgi:hypothetical protein
MRRLVILLSAAALVIDSVAAEQTKPVATASTNAPSKAAPTPKKEEPLLLLDEEEEPETRSKSMADNSRCQVCHLHLIKEDLALTHAKAGIGCAKCHGASDEHIADESWASGGNGTAPEIMFPKSKINPGCHACHPKEKLDRDFHEEFLAGKSREKYCTDCHGKHTIVNRKCRWK